MFGKKVLSIVCLIFLGSQISKVSAACVPTYDNDNGYSCAECEAGDIGYYFVASQNSLIEVTGANTCASGKVEVPGYYKLKNDSVYIVAHTSFIASPADTVDDVAHCVKGKIESENGELCLDGTNTVAFSSADSYLFNDDSHFISTDDNIAIKASGGNSIIKDGGIAGTDLCVRGSQVIKGKEESYCKDDCVYYQFTSGVLSGLSTIQRRVDTDPDVVNSQCNPAKEKPSVNVGGTSSSYHCAPGYYIVDDTTDALNPVVIISDEGSDNVENGSLYYCETAKSSNCSKQTGSEARVGYYVNAYYSVNQNVKYIQCDGTNCAGYFTDSTCSKAGDVSSSGGVLSLCINDNDMSPITLTSGGKYMVGVVESSTNAFTDKAKNQYSLVVELDSMKAVIAAKANPSKKYRYTSSTSLIYDVADPAVCSTGSDIAEYELYIESAQDVADGKTDEYDYYKSGSTINYGV